MKDDGQPLFRVATAMMNASNVATILPTTYTVCWLPFRNLDSKPSISVLCLVVRGSRCTEREEKKRKEKEKGKKEKENAIGSTHRPQKAAASSLH